MNDRVLSGKRIQRVLMICLSALVVYLVVETVMTVAQASERQQLFVDDKVSVLQSTVARLNSQIAALQNENNEYRSILEQHKLLAVAAEEKLVTLATTATEYKQLADKQAGLASEYRAEAQQLSSSVRKYEKLLHSDPELLKKYSKVYFLNENYEPEALAGIPSEYVLNTEKKVSFHAQALPFLARMIEDSRSSKVPLYVVSGYRSYREQQGLKSVYAMQFGTTAANSFSADQGYSEHQLGTALDLTSRETNGPYSSFAQTAHYQWLVSNAYKYGFVLSYADGNDYYKYEPWHWRFVGVRLATYLYDRGKYLADLDQRTIDTYLIDMFESN